MQGASWDISINIIKTSPTQVSLLQEQHSASPATLDSLKKASLAYLDPLIANLTAAGRYHNSKLLYLASSIC